MRKRNKTYKSPPLRSWIADHVAANHDSCSKYKSTRDRYLRIHFINKAAKEIQQAEGEDWTNSALGLVIVVNVVVCEVVLSNEGAKPYIDIQLKKNKWALAKDQKCPSNHQTWFLDDSLEHEYSQIPNLLMKLLVFLFGHLPAWWILDYEEAQDGE